MRSILLIARRELAGYLRTWSGYIIMAVLLALDGLIFNAFVLGGAEKRSSEVLAAFFQASSFFVGVGAVLFSMRLLAEERQTGTLHLLYSSPVRDVEIVLGKFLSAFAFLALMLALSSFMPALVAINGKVSLGHIAGGYLGLLLMGAACTAVGTFGSCLAKSQILAAIISGCILVALLMTWMLAMVTEQPLSNIFSAMALYNQHFRPFESGLIHLRDVVYYLGVTYVALFATVRVLEARRWR